VFIVWIQFPFVGVYNKFLFLFSVLSVSGPRSYPVPHRGERVKQRTVHARNLSHG
jgi:hypothetical protein